MLIIEGTDGVGKTTLAKALQIKSKSAYVHYGPLPEWWRKYDYTANVIRHAVYDRYHWSCWAYKNVLKQPIDLGLIDCYEIDYMLFDKFPDQYATVLLYSNAQRIREKYDETSPKEIFTTQQIVDVNERFLSITSRFALAYDVSEGFVSAERVIDDLMQLKVDLR